jgi:hypothetical protein
MRLLPRKNEEGHAEELKSMGDERKKLAEEADKKEKAEKEKKDKK